MLLDFAGIQWLAVVVATVAAFAIGMIWYSPIMFGKAWMAAIGKTDAEMKEMQKSAGPGYVLAPVGSFVAALVLALVFKAAGIDAVGDAIVAAIVLSIGLQIANMAVGGIFEGRKTALTMINGLNALVILVAQAVIIAVWPA